MEVLTARAFCFSSDEFQTRKKKKFYQKFQNLEGKIAQKKTGHHSSDVSVWNIEKKLKEKKMKDEEKPSLVSVSLGYK